MNETLYQRLCDVAAQRQCINYSEAGGLVDLDMQLPPDRDRLGQLLDEISEHEHANGRPLLSAVVIRADKSMPGKGFFAMAQRVGLFNGVDQRAFWRQQLDMVRNHWA